MGSFPGAFLNATYKHRVKLQKVYGSTNVRILGSAYDKERPMTKKEVQEAAKRLLFFSYRRCFTALPNGVTTDAGWGCLLRTGQMLMAYALMRFYAADTTHLPNTCVSDACKVRGEVLGSPDAAAQLRAAVQPLFMDSPDAPFGVHALQKAAAAFGLAYGVWLAPSQIGRVLSAAAEAHRTRGNAAPVTRCCLDRCINETETLELLEKVGPVLYLVPASLGIGKVSSFYESALLKMLSMESCCGIAGGKSKASIFFIGYQDRNVFYLDPHYVQKAFAKLEKPRKLSKACGSRDVSAFQSCMLIGFYIANKEAFQTFTRDLEEMNAPFPFPLIDVTQSSTVRSIDEAPAHEPHGEDHRDVVTWSSDG
ncbi:hypothetical protein STCU_00084 [Strigomonas culicis]|uniref:Cysteine protease n=1 Tax=Strigomonas culicis TaxID=28005 RepID=S9V8U4_9TRYP|nr:hypothetical protein STCU_00084 [Strigomonas culicis]|eukprot:EPY37213.1 hypothetical protein STCU_00084 [Strigomonas culicis]